MEAVNSRHNMPLSLTVWLTEREADTRGHYLSTQLSMRCAICLANFHRAACSRAASGVLHSSWREPSFHPAQSVPRTDLVCTLHIAGPVVIFDAWQRWTM